MPRKTTETKRTTGSKATGSKATEKSIDNGIKFYPITQIVDGVKTVSETDDYCIDSYELAPYVKIDMCYRQGSNDTAQLNLFGICIRCRVVEDKKNKRFFLALPSYKAGNGDYKDLVTIYNKEMHTVIRQLLDEIYG